MYNVAISFGGSNVVCSQKQKQPNNSDNNNHSKEVTAGVAGYGGWKYFLNKFFPRYGEVFQTVNPNKVTGLFANFKSNIKGYTSAIVGKFMRVQNMKYIGPLVKSPIVRGISLCLGTVFAFFTLVSAFSDAFKDGRSIRDTIR